MEPQPTTVRNEEIPNCWHVDNCCLCFELRSFLRVASFISIFFFSIKTVVALTFTIKSFNHMDLTNSTAAESGGYIILGTVTSWYDESRDNYVWRQSTNHMKPMIYFWPVMIGIHVIGLGITLPNFSKFSGFILSYQLPFLFLSVFLWKAMVSEYNNILRIRRGIRPPQQPLTGLVVSLFPPSSRHGRRPPPPPPPSQSVYYPPQQPTQSHPPNVYPELHPEDPAPPPPYSRAPPPGENGDIPPEVEACLADCRKSKVPSLGQLRKGAKAVVTKFADAL